MRKEIEILEAIFASHGWNCELNELNRITIIRYFEKEEFKLNLSRQKSCDKFGIFDVFSVVARDILDFMEVLADTTEELEYPNKNKKNEFIHILYDELDNLVESLLEVSINKEITKIIEAEIKQIA